MNKPQKDYKKQLFESIGEIIEKTGSEDPTYTSEKKALDILSVLESLLAYAIYSTCISTETIRDSAEESYVNIKRQALHLFKEHPIEE